MKLLLFACIALITLTASSYAQESRSPFAAPSQQGRSFTPPKSLSNPESRPGQETRASGLFSRFWVWVQTTQQKLHNDLRVAVGRIKSEGGLSTGFALILISFIYGVVHAAGPGHGKAVISSYVLANERIVRRGILLAFAAAVVQAISAIILVGVLAVVLNATSIKIRQTVSTVETASYGLIALVGAWLLFSQLRKIFMRKTSMPNGTEVSANPHQHHHHANHDEACCGHAHIPNADQLEKNWSLRNAAAIVFAVGIRPCTGAILVLIFALTQGIFWSGVTATFAMALGTAITVSTLAVLAVGSKQLALRMAESRSVWVDRISSATAIGGSFLVLALGLMLFIASLGPARPF